MSTDQSIMHVLNCITKRYFCAFLHYRLLVKSPSFAVVCTNRFASESSTSSSSSSSGTSSDRKRSSFAAEIPFADANQKAAAGGLARNRYLADRDQKQTYYYANRSIYARGRHWFLRRLHVTVKWIRRYFLYIFVALGICMQYTTYRLYYHWKYGQDAPITTFDWLMRKHSGTLDPEMIERGEQLNRYFRKRWEEDIPSGTK